MTQLGYLLASATDKETSYQILDQYVEAGGSFLDITNNYAMWVPEAQYVLTVSAVRPTGFTVVGRSYDSGG